MVSKIVFLALAIGAFCVGKFYFKLKDDNPVEEVAEYYIKDSTGLDIDLTPESPEVDNKNTRTTL